MNIPDSMVHGAHMGPTWVLSALGGPHVGPMNLAIRDIILVCKMDGCHFLISRVQTIICVYTVNCHYNACLDRAHMPSWPSLSGSAHGLKVWNHRCLIGHSGNDTPLFPYKWNKTKVSHLLLMSLQSIHYWSLIKHTDYSSSVLPECHHQANMAARCPDVENNPGSNQVNIRYMQ